MSKRKRPPEILGGKKRRDKRMVDLDKFFYDPLMFNGIIYGVPRTGKSVLLANFLNVFKGLGFNVFVNDCAKGYDLYRGIPKSEILMYFSDQLEFIKKDIRIFVPPGCAVEIPNYTFELVEIESYDDLFSHMKPNKLNIISFDSFVLPPLAFARFWALFSIEILYRSKKNQLQTPILGAIDQIHHVFPSIALRFTGVAGSIQDIAANWFARFLMDCSGSGIKMLATSHGITMIKKVVRTNFHWKFFKNFYEDVSLAVQRIKPAQKLIGSLAIEQVYATDDQSWGDVIPDIPDVPYEPMEVRYEGNFIEDQFWLLESKYQTRVFTPAEFQKLQKDKKADREANDFIRWRVGHFYLLGYTYPMIAEELGITEKTVGRHLNFCRQDEGFVELEEKLRPHWRSSVFVPKGQTSPPIPP